MKVKHLCPWCSTVLESTSPNLKEADNGKGYEELGRAVVEDRLLHVIMECKEVENAP